jgi:hypothetical protein
MRTATMEGDFLRRWKLITKEVLRCDGHKLSVEL